MNGSKRPGNFAWPWSRPEVRYVTARAPPGRPAGASQAGRGLPRHQPEKGKSISTSFRAGPYASSMNEHAHTGITPIRLVRCPELDARSTQVAAL